MKISMKKKENKKNQADKTQLDLNKIRFFDEDKGCFYLSDKSYIDIYKINSKDAQRADDEKRFDAYQLMRFYRNYYADIKFIALNFRVDTTKQRRFLANKSKKCVDEVRKSYLNILENELQLLDENVNRREYYMMIFAASEAELEKNRAKIKVFMKGLSALFSEITKEDKITMIKKLNNMHSLILKKTAEGEDYEENDN